MNYSKEYLLKKIKEADKAYYDLDNPIMSDNEYDKLRNSFLENFSYESLDYVPGNVSKDFIPFKHLYSVISLNKIKRNETEKLSKEIKKISPVIYEAKLDGLTVVAYPKDDGSCIFVTRGNGVEGEILPHFISLLEGTNINNTNFPIRGEVLLGYKEFIEINKERQRNNLPLFKNPRNAAAGILRNKERSPYIDKLQYICYDILGNNLSEEDKLKLISNKTKFTTIKYYKENDNIIKEIEEFYEKTIQDNNVPIDGVVIKSNIKNSLIKFGSTNHHPNNAFAWKDIYNDTALTEVTNIEWSIGKSKITPVAILKPVQLDGSIISKVSIHNINIINKLELQINDIVKITKINSVIPQIVEVVSHTDKSKNINIINECPICKSKLINKNNQLFCENELCPERLVREIMFLASKQIFNIKGLSERTAQKIIQNKLIDKPIDIFSLSVQQLITLDGFSFKSAHNLYEEILRVRSNKIPISTLIAATSIEGIGTTVGKMLINYYKDVNKLLDAINSDIDFNQIINGIGPIVTNKLHSNIFKSKLNDLLSKLYVDEYKEINSHEQLTFVITGTLSKPRGYFKKLIESYGYKVSNTITSKTNYLLAGEKAGIKLQQAKDRNIDIINEKDLDNIL